MAGVYTTMESRFDPISLQEMIIPLDYLTQKHDALADEQAKTEALAHSALAQLDPNSLAYQTKLNFINELHKQRDNLIQNGYSQDLKHGMSRLKADYAEKIIPIEMGLKNLQNAYRLYNEAPIKDPSTVFEAGTEDNLNIDSMIANPHYTPQFVSGNQIAQDVASQLQHITKQFIDDPTRFKDYINDLDLDPETKEHLKQLYVMQEQYLHRGLEAENFTRDYINNSMFYDLAKELTFKSHNITRDRFGDNYSRLEDAAMRGAWAGIGQEDLRKENIQIGSTKGTGSNGNKVDLGGQVPIVTVPLTSGQYETSEEADKQLNIFSAFSEASNFKQGYKTDYTTSKAALQSAYEGKISMDKAPGNMLNLVKSIGELDGKDYTAGHYWGTFKNTNIYDASGEIKSFNDLLSREANAHVGMSTLTNKNKEQLARYYYTIAHYMNRQGLDVVLPEPIRDSNGNINYVETVKQVHINEDINTVNYKLSRANEKYNPSRINLGVLGGEEANKVLLNRLSINSKDDELKVTEFNGYNSDGKIRTGEEVYIPMEELEKGNAQILFPFGDKEGNNLILSTNKGKYRIPISIIADIEPDIKNITNQLNKLEDYRKAYLDQYTKAMLPTTVQQLKAEVYPDAGTPSGISDRMLQLIANDLIKEQFDETGFNQFDTVENSPATVYNATNNDLKQQLITLLNNYLLGEYGKSKFKTIEN